MVATEDPKKNSCEEFWMRAALEQADLALDMGEVPVGAVVVQKSQLIGVGYNAPIGSLDPTGHAEVRALRNAALNIGNYRLSGLDLYVTLEPCMMCAGAIILSRIRRVVFGAREPKTGALVSTAKVLDNPALNHKVEVIEGILGDECAGKIQNFFRSKR